MKYLLIMFFMAGCATPQVCPVCPEPVKIDCAEQIKNEKIKAVTLLDQCREALSKYERNN